MPIKYVDDEPKKSKFRYDEPPAPAAEKKPEMPAAMRVLGNIGAGAIRGAGSIGATLLTPYDYLAGNTRSIGNPERREAMDNALSSLGYDTGSVPFGAGKFGAEIAGTAGIPIARAGGVLAQAGKNALAGGASAGLVNPEDAATGAAIGGAASPVLRVGKWVAEGAANKIVNPLLDLVRPGKKGAENVLGRYIRDSVGEANVPATVNAARASVAPKMGPGLYDVPGYRPTVAEAMIGVPEGSPLARLQDLTAQTKGGPSNTFGQIAKRRDVLFDKAEKARDLIADPAREAALDAAKAGVKTDTINSGIDALLRKSGNKANTTLQQALSEIKERIASLTDDSGRIDPRELYTIRKLEAGSVINKYAKENATWDKKFTAGLLSDVNAAIDDAIEKAGGKGWKTYLRDYAGKSQAIDSAKERAALMYNPAQKTNLGGGLDIANETKPPMPNLLSRVAMTGNFILRRMGSKLEPKIDELAAEVFSNPQAYADLMARTPPQMRFQLDKALRAANALAVYQAD